MNTPDTVQADLAAQKRFTEHINLIGCHELRRRAILMAQSEALISRLLKKAQMTPSFENETRRRLVEIVKKACHRADRRQQAYYGQ